jgi:hypothetical protein
MTSMSLYSTRRKKELGMISGLLVAVIGLSVLVLALGSFGIWAFVSYNDATDNVDGKIAIAVAQAREDKGTQDESRFAEEEKAPYKTFKAPDDYCGLSFQYPKTWSEYWSEHITNGADFRAYLNPGHIQPISDTEQFALRVWIEQKDYDTVVSQYQNLIQTNKLIESSTNANATEGVRLTGNFSNDIRGDAVIYRCRDKTITIRTDAKDTFKDDFQSIIGTIKFNA